MWRSADAVINVPFNGDRDIEKKDLFPTISDFIPPNSASHTKIEQRVMIIGF